MSTHVGNVEPEIGTHEITNSILPFPETWVRCPDCKGEGIITYGFEVDLVTGYEEPEQADCLTCWNINPHANWNEKSVGLIQFVDLVALEEVPEYIDTILKAQL